MGLSRTVTQLGDNYKILPPPRVFNAPAEGSPWNFVTVVGLQILE